MGNGPPSGMRHNAQAKLPGPPGKTLKLAKPKWRPRSASAVSSARNTTVLRRRNAKIPADLAAQWVGDFGMPRHCGSLAVSRVAPPRMPATLADQGAAVLAEVLK